jgi:membrane protein DedA with SNARE-associated domain
MDLQALTHLAADKAEPSKTAFYVCGAIAAVWAVVVSYLGFSRSDFPATRGQQRIVIAISVLVVLAAVSTAVITS